MKTNLLKKPLGAFDNDKQAPTSTVKREPTVILDSREPLGSAREFITHFHTSDYSIRTLHHHRGDFFVWNRASYRISDEAEIRSRLYEFLDGAKNQESQPFRPNRDRVSNVFDALKAAANLPATVEPPAWVGPKDGEQKPAKEFIVCSNGLLHLPSRELWDPSPDFFSTIALPVSFDQEAPDPKAWLNFLESLWPDDREAIDTLQEIFGYSLTPNTSQHKIFMLVGPKRSGKGTIARALTSLLGIDNVASPTLGSFGQNFGLEPLIGKMLATITDARLGGRADQSAIAERLLSVSGEDSVTIDRKFRSAWTGRLPTRFLVLTNEIPRIADASGALASRFIVLMLTNSFYGREDLSLPEKIGNELPGILQWALQGLDRLKERGHFKQPDSSHQAVEELESLGAPVAAFVKDRCLIGPGHSCAIDRLYAAWKTWCDANGRREPGTVQTFGRDLRAAVPGIASSQPRTGTNRERRYEGVDLQ